MGNSLCLGKLFQELEFNGPVSFNIALYIYIERERERKNAAHATFCDRTLQVEMVMQM